MRCINEHMNAHGVMTFIGALRLLRKCYIINLFYSFTCNKQISHSIPFM